MKKNNLKYYRKFYNHCVNQTTITRKTWAVAHLSLVSSMMSRGYSSTVIISFLTSDFYQNFFHYFDYNNTPINLKFKNKNSVVMSFKNEE